MQTTTDTPMEKMKALLSRWWPLLLVLVFLPVYILIARNNERSVDYVNNGFFTFWLSGRLPWLGMNPYSAADWVGSHATFNATWVPETIFPYPLPLALIMIPLGLLPIEQAYILWDVLAQLVVAGCILWMATHWDGLNRRMYAVFLLVAAILNGNVYLGLMTGTFAALFLFFLALGLYLMETRRPLLAGVVLSGLALKPPLLIILALIGLWLVFTRRWKTILGMALGGLGWLAAGLLQDPAWVQKFLGIGESMLSKRLGNQPTLLSYTRLACAGRLDCAFLLYGLAAAALIALYTWLVWKNRASLTPLQVFSAAIALGVLLPPYLWSYDYTLLMIPICTIAFEFVRRRASYLQATLFLLALDGISIFGMVLFWKNPAIEALTIQRDMWSIWVALLVLATAWWIIFRPIPAEPAPD